MTALGDVLRAGDRIWVAGSANEPTGLLQALAETSLPGGLKFIQFPLGGYNQTDFTAWTETTCFETFFMTPHLKAADPERLDFLPMQMRMVYEYLKTNVDVVLIQAAHDREGRLRLGPNVDFAEAALAAADRVAIEVNGSFTAAAGAPLLDTGQVACRFETDRPLYQMAPPQVDDVASAIGREVAQLIHDGDCLQTGIGSIPAAILGELGDHNDLGMHGGLIDDGGMHLIQAGNINGRNKHVDTGRHVTGMALGSHALHRLAG